ncbi:MFS transporter [Klebsiella variicola]|uniref:MFS transporter n=4 Tax=Klebsiella TaxID=570 RepID=UPI002FF663AD
MTSRYIAVDWGSTNFRAWLFEGERCLDSRQSAAGIARLNGQSPAAVLATQIHGWREGRTPVVMAGMHGIADVAGWRWLFAIEGVPAIVLGALVLWLLPSSPQKAAWLSEAEKGWLTAQIAADNRGAVVNQHASWFSALKNKVVFLLSLVWFLQAFGSIGITLFLPLILKSMASEQSDVVISLLSAVPFIFACLFMYLNGRHSDLTGERAWHMGLPLILAGLSLAVAIYAGNLLVAYLLLVLTVGFNFALTPVFWAVTTEKLAGVAAAASIAFINTIANIVGLGLPPLLGKIKDLTNSYHSGLLIVAVALALGGIIGIIVSRSGQKPSAFHTLKEDKL